jgi:hypothetical protein
MAMMINPGYKENWTFAFHRACVSFVEALNHHTLLAHLD